VNIEKFKPNKIGNRVRNLAQRLFSKTPRRRPQSARAPLRKANEMLRDCLRQLDKLNDEAWCYVGLSKPGEWLASEEREKLHSLIGLIAVADETIDEVAASTLHNRGAALLDGRLRAFVLLLSVIYGEESGEGPTNKKDRTGKPSSPFNQFAMEAVRLF
jgi:hypothetical protein